MPVKQLNDITSENMNKQKLDKWLKWLQLIETDVMVLLDHRYIFREVMTIVENNPKTHHPNDFVIWMQCQYAEATCTRVRRLCDKDSRTVSLRRLLTDIEMNSCMITREWFRSSWNREGTDDESRIDRAFDRWSGENDNCVDGKIVGKFLAELVQQYERVSRFINKCIAHKDESKTAQSLTVRYMDLHDVVDSIERQTARLISLLRQEMCLRLLPRKQYNWRKVFHEPWLPKLDPSSVRAK